MRQLMGPFRLAAILLLICLAVQGVNAWSVTDLVIKPASGPVLPGTAVTVSYMVRMPVSWTGSGETFDSRHTLDMVTQLDNGKWSVTMNNIDEDRGTVTTDLGGKTGIRYRINGWTLSYDDNDIELYVNLAGTVPAVSQTMEKTIIQVLELDESGKAVGGGKTVKYQVAVPTTAMTAATPATTLSQKESQPETPVAPAPTTSPTIKQTYSPGPEPVVIIGLLAILGVLAATYGKRKGR